MMRAPGIRAALHAHIDQTARAGSVVIDEYGVGSAVADVALFMPSGLHLFEIKSDVDSTRRLRWQVTAYGRMARFASLVCGPKMLGKARAEVPEWWGVFAAYSDGGPIQLSCVRAPRPNPEDCAASVAWALWQTETLALLKARTSMRGLSKARGAWRSMLAEMVPIDELRVLVLDTMRARTWNESRTPVRVVAEAA